MEQTFNKLFHSFIALIFGAAIWLYFWKELGGHDPQGGDSYWVIGYPIMFVGSTLFGYLFQERPWKWGVYVIGTQLFIGLYMTSGDLNMLPIGLIVHVIIAIPLVAGGYLGAWLFKRSQKHKYARLVKLTITALVIIIILLNLQSFFQEIISATNQGPVRLP